MSIRVNFGAFKSVTANKKKITLFLIVTALLGGLAGVCPGAEKTSNQEKKLSVNSYAQHQNSSETSEETRNDFSTQKLFYKMMLSVGLVIVLGVAIIYSSKKLIPKFGNPAGKKIKIIETIHLGPRKTVHLLEVANRQILVGSTNERITKLADLTDDAMMFSMRQEDDN